MGKNKKKSKSKANKVKVQSDSQSSVAQEPEASGAQIDIEPSDSREQNIQETNDSGLSNTTDLSEASGSVVEDIAQSDMKRKSSSFGESTGSDRRSGRDFGNSWFKNSRESNFDQSRNSQRSSNDRRSEPYKRSNQNEDRDTQKKRFSLNENNSNKRGPRDHSNSRRNYRNNRDRYDEEFTKYQSEFDSHRGNINYVKTREVVSDLFEVPDEYSLAHCVAEDMNMGSGIAVEFRYRFQQVDELLNQQQSTGGLAVLKLKNRYVYYLVTKRFSTGKPTYRTLFSSLKRLREHVIANGVQKLAMPRIGCGLDRLEWDDVKFMIEFLFRDVDVEIVVCNLEPTSDSSPQKHKNSRVTHVPYPIQDIEAGTVILYFSSEDEFVSEEMKKLDEKFHFLGYFKGASETLGNVVFYDKNKNYLLCGCIVRKTKRDAFDFMALQKCLFEIRKESKKNDFYYFAFQALKDTDSLLNYKIINILRNNLRGAEVYVCWPGELQIYMTPRDLFPDSKVQGLAIESSLDRSTSRSKSGDRRSNRWSSPGPKSWKDRTISDNNSSRANESDVDESFASSSSFRDHSMEVNNESPQVDTWDNPEPTREEPKKSEETSLTSNANHEYESFQLDLESGNIDCTSIKEHHPSNLPKQYSRVCYAREDLMNGGFPPGQDIDDVVGKLLNQYEKAGSVAFQCEGPNYLFCLIISEANTSPKSHTIFSAIQKLRDNAVQWHVKKLVIPKMDIGDECNFKWTDVKCMFQFLLGQHLEIIVTQSTTIYDSASLMSKNHNKITHTKSPIHQMRKKSAIIYLAAIDGVVTEEMNSLARKFSFKEQFQKKKKKNYADVIRYKENEDHVLYGCIVKRKHTDRINFEELHNCLQKVNKQNTEKLPVVGIQAVNDQSVNFKIATIMLNCLHDVNITMCWPGDLRSLMPQNRS